MTKISVIIPTLNEAARIDNAINSAIGSDPAERSRDQCEVEIIVSDANSTDETRSIASELGACVVQSPPGRGEQMDYGASVSTGELLLFLHADSTLPELWHKDVLNTLKDPKVSAGAFTLSIDARGWRYRILEYFSKLRAKHLGLIYGDQAIFTTTESFDDVGGFEKLPLFEDVDYVMKLKRIGKVSLIDKKVITSPRRWEKDGLIRNTLRNWFLLSLFMLGFNTRGLYKRYYKSPLTR
ncbi:MAG: TIGR04283 family arsenosugar biosynthesis glycosyltransferase [Proteobacteria bacterium]|nr:TIGR04283 family arsenosugar biosynthesis glycosyltransferase [Pseudomonadota bacterium]